MGLQTSKTVLKQVGYFLLGAVGLQLLRLFLLPGSARRRRRLGYLIANYGSKPSSVPDLPDVKRLSKRVIRVLGLNPGPFTLQGSNTYIVGTGPRRVLIDSGDGKPAYLSLLRSTLAAENATLSHLLITHEHEDHVGGIANIRKAFPDIKVWKKLKSSMERDPSGVPYSVDLANGTVIAEQGVTLRAILTPGHTSDHVAFFLEEEKALFTGDCVLGSGTAVFEDLHQYVGSLRVLQRELEVTDSGKDSFLEDSHGEIEQEDLDFHDSHSDDGNETGDDLNQKPRSAACVRRGRIYPGHGIVVEEGLRKIQTYLAHRQLREDQILLFLATHKDLPQSEDVIVEHIYADQHLSWMLKRGAKRSVNQHLLKLLKENKVDKIGKSLWVLKQGLRLPHAHSE